MSQITYTAAGAVSTNLNLPTWVDPAQNIDAQTGLPWRLNEGQYDSRWLYPQQDVSYPGGIPTPTGKPRRVGVSTNPQPNCPSTDAGFGATANPVSFNVPVVPPNAGKPVTISGTSGSTGDPTTDVNRVVSGQVPGTSVVFNSRG